MNIAFFDFDGTMTRKDSLFAFVQFMVGKRAFYKGIIARVWILLGYVLGICSNTYAKQRLVEYFFAGMQEIDFRQKCLEFLPLLESMLLDSALKTLAWHKARGDKVVMVSASFEEYLKPLCDKLGIECIATRLEFKDGNLTGQFCGENCYGAQKALRIQAHYNLKDYTEIFAYGDSKGDKAMLSLATHSFYRHFK